MVRPCRSELHPRLAEFRQREGLTQDQVAERVGISADMVRKHERGVNLPIPLYRRRYCRFYGATEEELGFRPSGQPYSELRACREQRGLSQSEVVAQLRKVAGCPLPDDLLNAYKRWERGKNCPSSFYAELLGKVLDYGADRNWTPDVERLVSVVSNRVATDTTPVSVVPGELVTAFVNALSNGARLVIGIEKPAGGTNDGPGVSPLALKQVG